MYKYGKIDNGTEKVDYVDVEEANRIYVHFVFTSQVKIVAWMLGLKNQWANEDKEDEGTRAKDRQGRVRPGLSNTPGQHYTVALMQDMAEPKCC